MTKPSSIPWGYNKKITNDFLFEKDLKKKQLEHTRLKGVLLQVTDQQHQEMTRAIELKHKNELLKSSLRQANSVYAKLKELNTRLQELSLDGGQDLSFNEDF